MAQADTTKLDRLLMGSIPPAEFIGREVELSRLVAHAKINEALLLVLSAPAAGASELLRQAYDALFAEYGAVVPIYFAWTTADRNAGAAARHYAHQFLRQYVAFRCQEAHLCRAQLSAREIIELAPAQDSDWLRRYWEAVEAARRDGDDEELVRTCLSATERACRFGGIKVCVFFDQMPAAECLSNGVALVSQIVTSLQAARIPAVMAGYRRQLPELTHNALRSLEGLRILVLEPLSHRDAAALVEQLAANAEVEINQECRDLLVEQTEGSPFYLRSIVAAAAASGLALLSFRNCQEIYVRELLGGSINRKFCHAWDEIVMPRSLGQQLLALFCGERKTALEYWRKRLNLPDTTFLRLIKQLQGLEWMALNGVQVELRQSSRVWRDYVKIRCLLEVRGLPRAQVLADSLAGYLKRAPQMMALRYRRASLLPVRNLLTKFDGQLMPYSLFDTHHYSLHYQDYEPEEILAAVRSEDTKFALPQFVSISTSATYQPAMKLLGQVEGCLVAHGFTGGQYTNDDEIIWITAQLDSKNPASRGLVKLWHDGLNNFAASAGIKPLKLWFLCRSGFTSEAREYLAEFGIYSSSAEQFGHLQSLLEPTDDEDVQVISDDFELVIPMTEDSELVATSALQQITDRIGVPPAIVNQIKTALVEACINATEHSQSPDRKIYQRFTVDSEKLTITVSSRGITQPHFRRSTSQTSGPALHNGDQTTPDRRGWGLKLIRSLMDTVEFERVDDGTRLRMTKYFKSKNAQTKSDQPN